MSIPTKENLNESIELRKKRKKERDENDKYACLDKFCCRLFVYLDLLIWMLLRRLRGLQWQEQLDFNILLSCYQLPNTVYIHQGKSEQHASSPVMEIDQAVVKWDLGSGMQTSNITKQCCVEIHKHHTNTLS